MSDENVAPTRAVFGIGVVADLTGTGVQNLRAYEKAGLVHPQRTEGGTRLYSSDDVARLRRITLLLDAGLNLAGIAMVLKLEDDNERLRKQIARTDRDRSNKGTVRVDGRAVERDGERR